MSADERWVSAQQYRGIRVGLRIVREWADAADEPETALHRALQQERDPADVVVGLATVARLLALEVATATRASETDVLDRLAGTVERLQYPAHDAAR